MTRRVELERVGELQAERLALGPLLAHHGLPGGRVAARVVLGEHPQRLAVV